MFDKRPGRAIFRHAPATQKGSAMTPEDQSGPATDTAAAPTTKMVALEDLSEKEKLDLFLAGFKMAPNRLFDLGVLGMLGLIAAIVVYAFGSALGAAFL